RCSRGCSFLHNRSSWVGLRANVCFTASAISQTLGNTLNTLASVMTLTRPDADVSFEKVA
ncbi:hypothetical protein, partial [Escherichia coli]|uniref:hypothetical protein n=1 Tax=Escherichia coli TaxID=562 RepID=UPI001BC854DE